MEATTGAWTLPASNLPILILLSAISLLLIAVLVVTLRLHRRTAEESAPGGKDGSMRHRSGPVRRRERSDRALLDEFLETGGRQITACFQPQVATGDGTVIGAEALARWLHDRRGEIPPDRFVPVLERAGEVWRLTDHMLDEALMFAFRMVESEKMVPISVNVSLTDLARDDFLQHLGRFLENWPTGPEKLTLELTETAVARNPDACARLLDRVKSMGVKLSLDDYGTGNSSLESLSRYPFDEIKIDRTFVAKMKHSHKDRMIVNSTIRMAHTLGLSVVAEGIEDEETRRILELMGCDAVQGYLFCRPLPSRQFMNIMEGRPPDG